MGKKVFGLTAAILLCLACIGRAWGDPGNGATPAVPGGGNPHANSPNAATPAVPGGGNSQSDSRNAATPASPSDQGNGSDKEKNAPQAHTTPSGVTTAQPGGGNPNSNSPNSATPASRSGKGSLKPASGRMQNAEPGTSYSPPVSYPASEPAPVQTGGSTSVNPAYDPNTGTMFPNGAVPAGPAIPPFQPRPAPVRSDGMPGTGGAPVFTPACLSIGNTVMASHSRSLIVPVPTGDWIMVMKPPHSGGVVNIRVGAGPTAVALSPDERTAYVACLHANSVAVVDLAGLRVTSSIPVGSRPVALAVSPGGSELFVANSGEGTVSLVDLKRGVSVRIPVGPSPQAVQVSSSGKRAFVVNTGDSSISIIDIAARKVSRVVTGR